MGIVIVAFLVLYLAMKENTKAIGRGNGTGKVTQKEVIEYWEEFRRQFAKTHGRIEKTQQHITVPKLTPKKSHDLRGG